MKASLRSLSKPVHALLSCTNSIKHAFPSLFQVDPSPCTHKQTDCLRLCRPPQNLSLKHRHTHPEFFIKTKTISNPTNSAVLSIPARTAFTFSVLASAMFVAARVTRPLVTPTAHPAVVTAAAAWYTNAMATTVRCTNLCGRQGHRKRQKRKWGRQTESKEGGWRWDGKGRQGGDRTRRQRWKKDKSESYCQGKAATLHYLVWWQLKRNSCTS